MPAPMNCEELKKPVIKHEREAIVAKNAQQVDDTTFKKLLNRRLKAHSSTWKELSNR